MKTIVFAILALLPTLAFSQTDAEEFYAQLNDERGNRRQLTVDSSLCKSAKAWVLKIKSSKLSHDYSGNFGEVLAKGTMSPFYSWMNSAGHKKTILNKEYRFVGYYYDKESGIACARFR